MRRIIKDGQLVDDCWRLSEAATLPDASAGRQHLLLPLPIWEEKRETLEAAGHQVGVWLAPDDSPEALLPQLDRIPLVAIHFPSFTDGRGYSQARLLRQRYGFRGELRAIGDVLRDQIYFLQQCGFTAFRLRADQNLAEALAALHDYSWSPLTGR